MTANTTMTETLAAPQKSKAPRPRPPGAASPRMQERLEREARARRALFVASVAGLAAVLGVISVTATSAPATDASPPSIIQNAADQRVIAEIPVQSADNTQVETIVRIMAPARNTPAPDVRTRAS